MAKNYEAIADRLFNAGPARQVEEQEPAAAPAPLAAQPAAPSKYDAIADRMAETLSTRVRTSAFAASQANPDTAARARKIAERTGMAPDAVERNMPTAERQVLVEDIDAYTRDKPALRAAYADPYFAKAAKDDLFTLTGVEKAVRRLLDPTADDRKKSRETVGAVGSFLAEGAKQLGMGATVGIGAGITDTAGLAFDVLGGVTSSEQLRGVATRYRGLATRARESIEYFSDEQEGNLATGFMSGMQSAGTNLALLPLGVASGSNALLTAMSTMVGAQSFSKARNKGQGVLDAAIYAAPDAVFEFAFEKIPASRLLEDIAKRSDLLTLVRRQIAPEVIGEQLTTLFQDFNEWVRLNPTKTAREFIEERPDAAVQTLVATLVGIGVQGGAIRGVQKVLGDAAEREARAKDAEVKANNLNDLVTVALGSKLRERDPETFADFVQQAADDGAELPSSVYVDAATLGQVLNQAGVDLAAFAEMSPAAAAAFEEAAQMGGSVAIPIGDLVGKMGDKGIEQALLPHLRASEDALSQMEAQEEQALAQQTLQEKAAAIMQQADDSIGMEQSAERVRNVMQAQLQATGRFAPDVNQAYAAVVGSFYTVLGADLGVTPEQAYAQFPLRVQASGQQIGEELGQTTAIGDALQERVNTDFEGAVQEYSALKDSNGGQVLNTDIARELSPEYREDRTRSADVHEAASGFVKRLYATKLSQPTPEGKLPTVLFTGGGTGAGKSTGLDLLAESSEAEIVYDTNMNTLDASATKIEQALNAGRSVSVMYVYRDPVEAMVKGALPRAMRMGRTVPLESHAETHVGARQVIEQLMARYADDPRVDFQIIDNSRGKGNAVVTTLDKIPQVSENGLKEKLYEEVAKEYQAGRISEAVARGTAGSTQGMVGPDSQGLRGQLEQTGGEPATLNQSGREVGDTRYRDRAVELLAGLKIPARSAVSIMDGTRKMPRLKTNFDIARFFTRTDKLDITKAPGRQAMVEALYADALKALTDAGSAVGWYDRKVKAAFELIAELHPEILTDEQAKFGFTTMLAITSNSTDVNENFEKAEELYRAWKDGNQWPVDVPDAKAAEAMRKGLQSMKDLVTKHGWQKVRDFMVADHTRAEIEAFSGEKIASELADSTIYGAVFLGSKIGAFFNNLYGNFTPVTMDRWFMRSVNRVRGEMLALPEKFGETLDVLAEQIREGLDNTYGQNPGAMLREIEAIKALGTDNVQKVLRAAPTLLAYSKARFNVYARGITTSAGKKRSYFPRTAENVLAKNIYEALTLDEQTPNGGGDRVALRKVMHMLQSKLADNGIPIEMADLQAVLWYYEKDLFATLKSEKAQAALFDDATVEAEDYETAARRVVDRIRGTVRGPGAVGPGPGGPTRRAAATPVAVDPTGDLFAQRGRADGYSSGGLAPLEGAPTVQGAAGPDPDVVAVAEAYAARAGVSLRRQAEYVAVDPERAARIAAAYEAMPHAPQDPAVREAYANLIRQTRAQYDALAAAGYTFTFFDSATDPYGGNPWNAMRDLRANKRMAVYGTYDGYGTEGITLGATENNPMLADTDLRWPDQEGVLRPVTANDLFRAVHDAFGHGLEGAGFRAQGEENAWQAHVRLFTGSAVGAITSETRGQNSWLNYGPHGAANQTARVEDTVFADQKTGLMPAWTWTEGVVHDMLTPEDRATQVEQRRMRQAVDLAILQQQPTEGETLAQTEPGVKPGEVQLTGVHFSTQPGLTFLHGSFYGRGLKGFEAERVRNSPDKRLASRTYFYVDEGKGVRPEAGVGGNAHQAELTNLYDINADPLKLIVGGDINATESNILNAGFSGYYRRDAFNQQGAAVVIGPASGSIPVVPIANPTTAAPPLPAAPQVYKRGLMSSELKAINIDAIRTVAPSARISAGTFTVLQSEQAAAAEVAKMQGIDLPTGLSQGDGTRGTYNPKSLTITLLENADLTTFLHETGHFMLDTLATIAARPDAPVRAREDMAELLKWFGVKDLATWHGMKLDEQRPHHEKFAEGFEQYLFEGKAPSTELQPLFRRFKQWFQNIYVSLQRFMRSHNTQLTEDVRAVFDRMLATDEQIAQAEEVAGLLPDMDATELARERLTARSLRDLKWAVNARTKIIREMQKEARELREKVQAEVTAQVSAMPEYAAKDAIDRLRAATPEYKEALKEWGERRDAALERAQEGAKAELLATHPDVKGIEKGQLLAKNKRMLANKAEAQVLAWEQANPKPVKPIPPGFDAQLASIADVHGFTSTDHMLQAISEAWPKAAMIDGLTDQTMLERHGDLVDQAAVERAANEAVHNEARARALATELQTQSEMLGLTEPTGQVNKRGVATKVNILVAAAKQFSAHLIGRTKIIDLQRRPAQHGAAERRAAKRWLTATKAGNTEDAVDAKRDQMLNHAVVREANKAIEKTERWLEYLKKFDKEGVRKSIPQDYLDQIDGLLEAFDLRVSTSRKDIDRRVALQEWVEQQRAQGIDPPISDRLLEGLRKTSYKELTVDELQGLRDTVTTIEHLGRLKGKLLRAKDKREFDLIANEIADSIREHGGTELPVRLEPDGQVARFFKGAWADHRKVNSLVHQMDGGNDNGPFYRAFVRTMNEAGAQETEMLEAATSTLAGIYAPIEKLPGGFSGDKVFIPEINNSLSRAGRLSVALNWGNAQNRQRVLDGDGWTEQQVNAILARLTPAELDFVNKVWEFIDGYWPDIKAKQLRVTGVSEEKVEAVPFDVVLPDGTTVRMRGGYYPIKYDTDRSIKAERQEAAELGMDMLRGAFGAVTTRRGHTKKRADEVKGRPVRKDLSVITQHTNQVVHDLAWHEWFIDANKILNDSRIASAIRDHHGPEILRSMKSAIEAVAIGDVAHQSQIDQLLMRMRANVTRSIMGVSATTAFLQPFGLTQSMARIGVVPVLKGAARWAGESARMESTVGWVSEKSTFMRSRANTFNRELREISQRVQGKSKFSQVSDAALFFLMKKMQLVADIPTWVGMYEKALAGGVSEDTAVQLADEAVLASQGGGNIKDLSGVQRNLPFLTQFYSYFNTTMNLVAEKTALTDFKSPKAVAGWLGDMVLLTVIPAILPALVTHLLKGGGEDDEPADWAKNLAEWQASYLFGMFVGLRELPTLWSPFDYGGPPAGKLVNDGKRLVQQAAQGEIDDAAVLAVIGFLGTALGLPTTQVIRSYKGWQAWAEGDAPATSVLFGPPPKN